MNRILLFILILASTQHSLRGQAILDQYVKQAIDQNLSVDEKQALEWKQEYALEPVSYTHLTLPTSDLV